VFFEETPRQAARLASFGRRRLLVVSRDPAAEKDRSAESVAQERAWAREQKRMKELSPRSWRVSPAAADMASTTARSVVAELTQLIEHLRGAPPPPFGTTVGKEPIRDVLRGERGVAWLRSLRPRPTAYTARNAVAGPTPAARGRPADGDECDGGHERHDPRDGEAIEGRDPVQLSPQRARDRDRAAEPERRAKPGEQAASTPNRRRSTRADRRRR
jgi:hypothetical protein